MRGLPFPFDFDLLPILSVQEQAEEQRLTSSDEKAVCKTIADVNTNSRPSMYRQLTVSPRTFSRLSSIPDIGDLIPSRAFNNLSASFFGTGFGVSAGMAAMVIL